MVYNFSSICRLRVQLRSKCFGAELSRFDTLASLLLGRSGPSCFVPASYLHVLREIISQDQALPFMGSIVKLKKLRNANFTGVGVFL